MIMHNYKDCILFSVVMIFILSCFCVFSASIILAWAGFTVTDKIIVVLLYCFFVFIAYIVLKGDMVNKIIENRKSEEKKMMYLTEYNLQLEGMIILNSFTLIVPFTVLLYRHITEQSIPFCFKVPKNLKKQR